MTCDARNWNSFLMKSMLICAKMRRLGFSSLNEFRFIFWRLYFSLLLSIWLLDSLNFLLQIASSFSSAVLVYLSFFQNFLIYSKTFIAKRRNRDSFKCKPFALKCLLMIFILSTMSIFDCSRYLISWFTVSVGGGVEINTLQSGNFSCISDLKFRSLFNISLNVE